MPLRFCVRACAPIKTPSDEHDTGDGEKEQAAQPCFHLYPLLTAWKTPSSDTWKTLTPVCVCQCVCETVPYFMLLIIAGVIFLLASECLMKKQLRDVFVWFALMRWDSWKQLWWCDRLYTRIWHAVCVFHLNVLLLSLQLIHWLIAVCTYLVEWRASVVWMFAVVHWWRQIESWKCSTAGYEIC